MNILKISVSALIFLLGGFFAGLLSLLFSSLLPSQIFLGISLPVILEESFKLIVIFKLLQVFPMEKNNFFLPIPFALGFALLEFILIQLNPNYHLSLYFVWPVLIHITTSFLLFILVKKLLTFRKLSTLTIVLFTLVFLIHLCYNVSIKMQ